MKKVYVVVSKTHWNYWDTDELVKIAGVAESRETARKILAKEVADYYDECHIRYNTDPKPSGYHRNEPDQFVIYPDGWDASFETYIEEVDLLS